MASSFISVCIYYLYILSVFSHFGYTDFAFHVLPFQGKTLISVTVEQHVVLSLRITSLSTEQTDLTQASLYVWEPCVPFTICISFANSASATSVRTVLSFKKWPFPHYPVMPLTWIRLYSTCFQFWWFREYLRIECYIWKTVLLCTNFFSGDTTWSRV